VNEIRKHIACDLDDDASDRYETYDISIYFIDDETMQEANRESRNVDEPTDILSFQFHEATEPGVLEDPLVDLPDYYNLGDVLIDVPYVIRCCEEDKKRAEESQVQQGTENSAQTPHSTPNENSKNAEGEEDDDEEWVDDDRGVSGAMSKVYDPEQRIRMLLVHGMLHLVGYDHEKDHEYDLMVTREEEILQLLEDNGLLLPSS
jgi:probable rRNA maturation factor